MNRGKEISLFNMFLVILRGCWRHFACKKKKEKTALIKRDSEAQLEVFILTDIIILMNTNYLNFSINDTLQRFALDAQLEVHLPQKRGLDGHSGSIPGEGASAFFVSENKLFGGWK